MSSYAPVMPPTPLYAAASVRPAYALRFGWTGWMRTALCPPLPEGAARQALLDAWERDGIRLLKSRIADNQLQATFSTRPHVSPVFLAARVKGRLLHAYRTAGIPIQFKRKLAVRSMGETTRTAVERYVRDQLVNADLADPRYLDRMRLHHHQDPDVRLEEPQESDSGRYWYNLHLVWVTADRLRMGGGETPETIREMCLQTARKRRSAIAELSVMPDHVHMAVRVHPEVSPEEMALAVMNNAAWGLGQFRFWQNGYYAGTFGEYTMRAVRHG
jgi:REP element-mobilizing transposase RayT